jgi:hypothetical protein
MVVISRFPPPVFVPSLKGTPAIRWTRDAAATALLYGYYSANDHFRFDVLQLAEY